MPSVLEYQTQSPGRLKIPMLRWIVAILLFLAAVLNYIDRNILGLLAPTIQKDLNINDQQYANVVNFFLVAYTLAYLFSGRIVDWLGSKISMAIFIGWWSVSNALTGLARSFGSLSCVRFMLGLGEAGSWVVAPKVVSEWFPAKERALAVGVYSVGGSIGATIAPWLVVMIAANFGWRWTFAATPLFALLWLGLWLLLYRRPAGHPLMTEREANYLSANLEPPAPEASQPREPELVLWGRVLRNPAVWQLMIARLLTDPVWYFYQFWMAKYFNAARNVKQQDLSIMWKIFVAADIGFLLGGFLSGRLIRRGTSPAASRLWVMAVSACLVPLSALIPKMPGVTTVIIISMCVVYAHTAWLSNITSLVVDVVPKRILGTSFGLIACGSALGGIFMNQIVAWLINHWSYDYCFYLMAFVHPIALAIVWWLRRHRETA